MAKYQHGQITISILIITSWNICFAEAICPDDFFGSKCQYKCHCFAGCDEEGNCLRKHTVCNATIGCKYFLAPQAQYCDEKGENCHLLSNECDIGWFGLACQYQNLADWANVQDETNQGEKLTDKVDRTCTSEDVQNITLTWSDPNVFTWLRIVIKNETLASDIKIHFRSSANNDSPLMSCNNRHVYLVKPQTLDIRCDVDTTFEQMTLTGRSLCSLYINGGRNIALHETTHQSSILANRKWSEGFSQSSNAVDGRIDYDFDRKSCMHTAFDDHTPFWEIEFIPKSISRYVIYNKLVDSLNSIELRAFKDEEKLFEFIDTSNKKIITGLNKDKSTVSRVRISNTHTYLHLCEVLLYGECPLGTWGLNCTPCPSICPNNCHLDTGECNGICFGYEDPPNCNKSCPLGYWGINCRKTCTSICKKCHHTTGQCIDRKPGNQDLSVSTSVSIGVVSFLVMILVLYLRRIFIKQRANETLQYKQVNEMFNDNSKSKTIT